VLPNADRVTPMATPEGIPIWQVILTSVGTGALSFLAALTGFRTKQLVQDVEFKNAKTSTAEAIQRLRDEMERDREDVERRHIENRKYTRENIGRIERKVDVIIEAAADLLTANGHDRRYSDTALRMLAEVRRPHQGERYDDEEGDRT